MTNDLVDLRNPLARIEERIEREVRVLERAVDELQEEVVMRDCAVREVLELKGDQSDLRIREAFAASEKAIDKALESMNVRFDSVNEFRGELSDRWAKTLSRDVYEVGHKELGNRIDDLREESRKAVATKLEAETYATTVQGWTLWRESVERQLNEATGGKQAVSDASARMIAVVVMVAAVAAVVVAIVTQSH